MSRITGALPAIAGVIILLIGFHFLAVESGEVATVWTKTPAGEEQATRLWVVEHDDRKWLAAGGPDAEWLQRIQGDPQVRVDFRGQTGNYAAHAAPEARAQILTLMDQKYGWANTWVRTLVGKEAVPVRLEPQ